VNEAWNEWVMKAKWEYIMVINDDIILYNDTITKMMLALETSIVSWPYFRRADEERIYSTNWKNIVWFCYMFKKKDRERLFPIDPRLQLWFWDNWIYEKANRNIGWWWFIYHFESKTLFSEEHKKKCLEIIAEDKIQWEIIKKENWWI